MTDMDSSAQPKTRRTPRAIGCALIALALLAALVAAGLRFGQPLLARLAAPDAAVPLPIEDDTSPQRLAEFRAPQVERLNSTGWISPEAGIAHIPIATAMALVAEEGLPVAQPTPEPEPSPVGEGQAEAGQTAAAPEVTQEEAPDEPASDEADQPSGDAPSEGLTQVTYNEHVLPIFETYCGECHGAEDPEEQLELTRYRTTMVGSMNGPVIEPGDPDNSYLYKQIVEGRMPKDADPLSPDTIELIRAWIEAGAPEQ